MSVSKDSVARKSLGDFDDYAKDYRQIHDEHIKLSGADSDYFSEQKVRIVRDIETADDLRVLDLGCGDGNSARFFRLHFPSCAYTGVDSSEQSIVIAQERHVVNAQFLHYDGDSIPLPDQSFDIVFVACVFHHIHPGAHAEVLKEIRRVLRDGGRLYIFEHNPLNPLTRRVVRNCPFDEEAILLHAGYTRKMLAKLEFVNVDVGYTIFFPQHKVFRGLHILEPYLSWLPLGGQYYARAVK